jgi:putative SOS response-associated peptidase YedK
MCYNVSAHDTERAYKHLKISGLNQVYYLPGFIFPKLPTIVKPEDEDDIKFKIASWGLLPFWAKDDFNRNLTLNARSETIFHKPAFRGSVKNRCIIPVDGFFEWRHEGKKTYPFFIYLDSSMLLGGLFACHTNKDTGEMQSTFTLITTQAVGIMSYIHNEKQRMPLILDEQKANFWLEKDLSKSTVEELMQPYAGELKYHTIKRINPKADIKYESKEIIQKFEYPELNSNNNSLF